MKENEKVIQEEPLTRALYLELSTDLTTEIANLKDQKENTIKVIEKRKENLVELRKQLEELRKKIAAEEAALSKAKKHKYVLQRNLKNAVNLSGKLNKSFFKGKEFIISSRFRLQETKKVR